MNVAQFQGIVQVEVRFADEERGGHDKKLGETRISRVVSEISRLERNSQKNVATSRGDVKRTHSLNVPLTRCKMLTE